MQPDTWNKGSAVICPPGSGKSTWISEIAPNWLIGNHPSNFILHLHTNDEKADAFFRVIQSVWTANARHSAIFPDVEPDLERGWTKAGLYFKWRPKDDSWPQHLIDGGGWAHMPAKDPQYYSMGFGGGIIGRRAHTIILDDPFDPADMDSVVMRNRFARRFKLIVRSRLLPGGRIIFVANRWHYDDLVPTLEEMGYDIITFPAIRTDEYGKRHSYWPEMWSLESLDETRKELGAVDFQCLYQGDPTAASGAIIKREWFKYFDYDEAKQTIIIRSTGETIHLSACRIFQAVDPAASSKDVADFFVIATVAEYKGRMFVLDIIRLHLEGPDQPDLILYHHQRWHSFAVGIEKSGYQLTLIQYCIKRGIPIIPLAHFSDKTSRHLTLAARYQSGIVYHRSGASWLGDLELELVRIPKVKHDDQADALADCTAGLATASGVLNADTLNQLNRSTGREISRIFHGSDMRW